MIKLNAKETDWVCMCFKRPLVTSTSLAGIPKISDVVVFQKYVRGCLQPKYCTLSSFFKGTPLQSRGSWESDARATARHFHCKSQVFIVVSCNIIAIAVLWSLRQTSVAWTMLSQDSQRPLTCQTRIYSCEKKTLTLIIQHILPAGKGLGKNC